MLYYAIRIENYFDSLIQGKKNKDLKKTGKTFKLLTRKLNKTFNDKNTVFLTAYVYQLDKNLAKVFGFVNESVLTEKDLVQYIANVFKLPDELNTLKIEKEDYDEFLKLALNSGSFSKKVAENIELLKEMEAYIVNGDDEASDCKNNISTDKFNNTVKDSYKRLHGMVGLTSVKKLVEQIIASMIMDKKRDSIKKLDSNSSKHMLFTGEPGSAKTTVARLLAGTLKETGVLETGVFVECGRQQLVGKYTGWTAVQVSEKFKEAKGGVLFIDEAYSLVSRDDFGSEAINTIVQEMENHRDEVIVIFAGYPDKMEEFLNNNQGLKSRIAFHVDFPNYNVDELVDIFRNMASEKGFTMDEEVIQAVKEMCEAASKVPNFGNGRFVRNVLEQAILKQSQRLLETHGEENVPEAELFILKKEDIDLSYTPYKDNTVELVTKRPIGFVA